MIIEERKTTVSHIFPQVEGFFNIKDRDRDGRISFEEFCDRETVNERAFKAMDLNNDGFVTKTEMLKASNRGSRRYLF